MRILDNKGQGQAHLHSGVFILDKIIKDLKAKLPLGKKAKGGEEESEEIEEETDSSQQDDRTDATDISEMDAHEEEDDEPQSKSLVYKLKKKIQALQKKNVKLASKASDDDDEIEGETDSEAEKKKKKSKIIQIVIGVLVVGFLLSDYIIPTEEPVPTPVLKPRPKKKPKVENAGTETAGTETPATDEPKADESTPDEPAIATDTQPGEDTSGSVETTPDSPVTVTSSDTDVPTDTGIETSPEATDTVVDTPVEPSGETVTTDSSDESNSFPVDNSNVDTVDGGETQIPTDDGNITDQILQDLEKQAKDNQPVEQKKEYVSPPDYEYRGRGLVYNCKGKHWACVDAPSYKTCEENASSVKFLNKKTECYPFNVYETPKGCENMQNRMVSSSAKTQFCNE